MMLREDLVFIGTCDMSGQVRGKGFPASEIAARRRKGVGWTHSLIMQTAFGPIMDTPFGTAGDLMIVPDPAAEVRVDFEDGSEPEHFVLGDLRNTDGSAWECCPREFLRRAIAALEAAGGWRLVAAFEQEFVYTGTEDRPGDAYSLGAFRRGGSFGASCVAALRAAGVTPDSFLAEYGARQFEVTVAPAAAMTAADHAVITREIARATAFRLGHRASFTPMPATEGVGSGGHIHFSLRDAADRPAMHDPAAPFGLGEAAAQFCAGVLHHLPAIAAITAPSPVSYLRLTPNRWAPTAIDIVQQDRGAALRVCPVFVPGSAEERARQHHVEFRACDGSSSPYMALGAVILAGADGIARKLALPAPGHSPAMLPHSLAEALTLMEASGAVQTWFGPVLMEAYLRNKRSELAHIEGLGPDELCRQYLEIF